VFVQNLGPGATARMGLAAGTLQSRYPRLIVCDLSGYGLDGPWADRKAYDALVQCETGVVALTGTPNHPAKTGISIADIAGGMYAYTGILTALYRRATTGAVDPVEVSLFDALGEWMGAPAYFTGYGGTEPERVGAEHATIVPYGPFTAGDGVTVLLAIQNEREWASLCRVFLGDIEVARRYHDNPARLAHREEVNALVANRFGQLTGEEAVALLEASRVAYAHLNSVRQFLDHPALSGRDRWREVETPAGSVRALLPPATIRGVPSRMDAVPTVGAHTDAILAELGYRPEEAAKLREAGAV
jgi:formyl-CoA transferase